MQSKSALKKIKKLEQKKLRKERVITPQEILSAARVYNRNNTPDKRVKINKSSCFDKIRSIIGPYLKDPNNFILKEGYYKKLPDFSKTKRIIIFEYDSHCFFKTNFFAAGGKILILPLKVN